MPTVVLIVDDSKLARIVTAKALQTLAPAWERIEAGNADDAMAMTADRRFDVALLDYNMPGRDGIALATEIRAAYPTMPIAIVTANLQDEVIAEARAINAIFVAKPVTVEGLRAFVSGAELRLEARRG